MDTRSNWLLETKVNHPKQVEMIEGNTPVLSPIFQTAKFALTDKSPYFDQFIYTRGSNPTLKQLEDTISELQGREDTVVVSSGIASITGTLLSLLENKDHLITFKEIYKPSRVFIREILPKYGIENTSLSLSQVDKLEDYIKPGKTKLIHFESPTNPNLVIADIERIINIAHANNILVSMDGTFAGLHQHNEFDIDVMVHSLTKYGNGHGDVIAGCISGKASLIRKIRDSVNFLGTTLDPHAAYLIQRGLKTYFLRYERISKNALEVATYLENHKSVQNVFYPGLKSHEQFSLAQKQMKDMGGVVSFVLRPELGRAEEFCHKLKMIQFAASLGSTETLICPSALFFANDLNDQEKQALNISSHSLRLSIGLENSQDIIADLSHALS